MYTERVGDKRVAQEIRTLFRTIKQSKNLFRHFVVVVVVVNNDDHLSKRLEQIQFLVTSVCLRIQRNLVFQKAATKMEYR